VKIIAVKVFQPKWLKRRNLKKFRLEREVSSIKLSSQLGAGQLRVRIYPVDGEEMNIYIFEPQIKIELCENHRSEGVST